MVQKILAGAALLVVAFIAFVATRPSNYHVERSIDVNAPADVVFAQIDDFHAWAGWSPYEKLDPAIEKTYEGPARAVGSSYAWKGNSRVGKGTMKVVALEPGKHLGLQVEFIVPFKSVVATDFTVAQKGSDAVTLTWATDGHSTFMGKLFGLMITMDELMGADYEKGLKALKEVAEAEAVKQKAEAAQAAAAQAAAAQAAAAQAAAAQATAAQAAPQQH